MRAYYTETAVHCVYNRGGFAGTGIPTRAFSNNEGEWGESERKYNGKIA